jgi:DNA-binding PadR family transcriptional regulator/polyisoprenoid-binding protein YceI
MGQGAPDDLEPTTWSEPPHCHFELSAPRHFVYPAILLLLSEKPRHGYRLIEPLIDLGFGPVDRPTVYRALGDLERDGLLESWNAEPKAGATRHVYALTEAGRRALHHWMEVLAAERDVLELVWQRYALLDHHPRIPPTPPAEVLEWPAPALARSTDGPAPPAAGRRLAANDDRAGIGPTATRFDVLPETSAIMIRARSNVGAIDFGTTGMRGTMEAAVHDSVLDPSAGVHGRIEVDVAELTSGNSLYDAELMHRVHARMFPVAVVELDDLVPLASEDRFQVTGHLTFHGVTTHLAGTVSVTVLHDRKIVVSGEQVIDIRKFEIAAPTMLMLKIYPDVRVYLHLEAEASTSGWTQS